VLPVDELCLLPELLLVWLVYVPDALVVEGHSILECETKRTAYVALSRAAQRLVIVAPHQDAQWWRSLIEPDGPDSNT
jgi:hypothetical protein